MIGLLSRTVISASFLSFYLRCDIVTSNYLINECKFQTIADLCGRVL